MDIMEEMQQNIETRQKVIDFLKSNVFASIATVSIENKPNCGAILYLFDDNLDFYFVTRSQSRKNINLQSNSNIAIVVGTGENNISIQAEGMAEAVKDKARYFVEEVNKKENLSKLFYGPLMTFDGVDFVVYKVRIDWIKYMEVKDNNVHTEEYYLPIA